MAARKPILNLSLTSGLVDLGEVPHLTGSIPTPVEPELETPPSLIDLFPDLAVYSGPIPSVEEKIHKRLDEGHTSGHRVAHTSRLMDIRPVLVSSLQPARNTLDGTWDLHDGLWFEDPKGSTDVGPDTIASTSSVFTGRGYLPPSVKGVPSLPVPAAQELQPQHAWTDDEDLRLRRLVQAYPFHWQLIADSLGSELISIPTDKPSAYECWDRWYWQSGEGKGRTKPEVQMSQTPAIAESAGTTLDPAGTPATQPTVDQYAPGAPSAGSNSGTARPTQTPQQTPLTTSAPTQPTTNGEAAYEGQGPPPPGLSKREARQANKHKYEGSRKSVRHQVLYDSVRRLVRRREATKQKTSGEAEKLVTS